jgi:peptidoglycan-N-acetylglucosamine deacetylase
MTTPPESPVFYDPGRKRWPWVKRVTAALGIVVLVLLIFLAISITINPVLPLVELPGSVTAMPGTRLEPPTSSTDSSAAPTAFREAKRKLTEANRGPRKPKKRRPAKPEENIARPPLVIGFCDGDDTGMSSLRQNIDNLDAVITPWLRLEADGRVSVQSGTNQQALSILIRRLQPEVKIVATISNFDGRERDGAVAKTFQQQTVRAELIQSIMTYCRTVPLDGFCLDVENLSGKGQGSFQTFVVELAQRLHQEKLLLYLAANVNQPVPHRLVVASDLVLLKAFDERENKETPGPLASQSWFEAALKQHAELIPPEKFGVVIGSYARDWREGSIKTLTYDAALVVAREQEAIVRMDPASRNVAFRYEDRKDRRHDVWMLDAASVFNLAAAAHAANVRATALWKLGTEDPAVWRFFTHLDELNETAAKSLTEMDFKYGIDYTGHGEVIRIDAKPTQGKREVHFDPAAKRITACEYTQLPSPFVIRRYGEADKKIALTFDDGPDPVYTIEILNILKREGVPATFFIVGGNGELYPELLSRIASEGHEFGNHTFTHPNISQITPTQMQLELSATQRLLESVTGRGTVLFRPPYGEDSDPSTADEVRAIEAVNDLGYLTVGMRLDPYDWQMPAADEIVRRVVERSQSRAGNIVLLHDSGGDRTQTVKALPKLIDELRLRGFTFAPVSELLGRSRDEIMPPVVGFSQVPASVNRVAFGLVTKAVNTIRVLFTLGIILGLARLLFIGALAVVDARRKRRMYFLESAKPAVAVIVPAFNEEKVIAQTIASLLASDYPQPFEIIVVDDGSKDKTFERAMAEFGDNPRVQIFKKPNGGKSAALNFGIAQTKADVIVAMDADTVFPKDTISKLARHFSWRGIGAVAGNAKVGNRLNILTKWQALEYITSQNLDRRAFNVLDCITVVPGAVGAWRRELVVQAGGFGHSTLAEDADLTIAIRRMGYAIVNEDEALAYTEAPDTMKGFVKQRFRWMFGTLQTVWKHKRALFNPNYGALGFVALPNVLVFQVFFPLISPVMDLMMLLSVGSSFWAMARGAPLSATNTLMILAYYLLFTAIDFGAALLAFSLEPREDKTLLWWLFPQRFCYRQLMYYVAIKSTIAAFRGMEVGWGKLERKATVTAPK